MIEAKGKKVFLNWAYLWLRMQ